MRLGNRSAGLHGMCVFHPEVTTQVAGQLLEKRCYYLAVVSSADLSAPMVPQHSSLRTTVPAVMTLAPFQS